MFRIGQTLMMTWLSSVLKSSSDLAIIFQNSNWGKLLLKDRIPSTLSDSSLILLASSSTSMKCCDPTDVVSAVLWQPSAVSDLHKHQKL